MKRKLTRAQGMVEYALLLTMVAVPMIVIYATLGEAVGEVWQSIIDSLDDSAMFTVGEYTLNATATDVVTVILPTDIPTSTFTVDPYGPPTDVPTETEVPTSTEIPPTATHFVPATMTATETEIPPTETATEVPTAIPTATPVYVSIKEISSYWQDDKIIIGIKVDSEKERVLVVNVSTGGKAKLTCSWYCTVEFYDETHVGGYVTITTPDGDDINYYYPARSW